MENVVFSLDDHHDELVTLVGNVLLRGSTSALCQIKGSQLFGGGERFVLNASLREATRSFAVLEGRVDKSLAIPVISVEEKNLLEHAPWTVEKAKQLIETCSGFGCMGVGFQKAGIRSVAFNDCNPHFAKWVSQKGPTVEGHIGSTHVIRELFELTGGSTALGGGVACQPYSMGGDRKGGDDERAQSLPGMLKAAFLLNTPWLVIECVSEAQNVPFVIDCIGTFIRATGFTKAEAILHLQKIWPSRRSRWWCILATPGLGLTSIPMMPVLQIEPVLADLVPGFRDWESRVEKELELDLYELRTFSDHGGLDSHSVNPEKALPTALHAWGSQAKACHCGCRNSGFAPHRLATKGLYAATVPLEGIVKSHTCMYPRMRHLHPEEVALCNALPPGFLHETQPRNMRFELAGVGQLASPAQSVWVASTVVARLNELFGYQGPTHDEAMLSLLDDLFAARDSVCLCQAERSMSFERAVRSLFNAKQPRQKTPQLIPLANHTQSVQDASLDERPVAANMISNCESRGDGVLPTQKAPILDGPSAANMISTSVSLPAESNQSQMELLVLGQVAANKISELSPQAAVESITGGPSMGTPFAANMISKSASELISPSWTTHESETLCQSYVAPTGGLLGFANQARAVSLALSLAKDSNLSDGISDEVSLPPAKRPRSSLPSEEDSPTSNAEKAQLPTLAPADPEKSQTFEVMVVCWEEPPFVTRVSKDTTVGQVTVATEALAILPQPIRPQNLLGQQKPLSETMHPNEVISLRYAPCVKPLVGPWSDKPEFDPDRVHTRLDLLWCQQAFVALDEMQFYLDAIVASPQARILDPKHFDVNSHTANLFVNWLDQQRPLPEEEATDQVSWSAILIDGHWSPVSIHFRADKVFVSADATASSLIKQW